MTAQPWREYVRAFVQAAGTEPLVCFGSPEWEALPNGPQKVAAVVVAAGCWAEEGERLVQALADELGAPFTAQQWADAQRRWDIEDHRERWSHLSAPSATSSRPWHGREAS